MRAWVVARSAALLDRLLFTESISMQGSKQECIRVVLVTWLSYIPVSTAGIPWPTSSGIRKNMPGTAADIRWQIEHASIYVRHGWVPQDPVLLWMLALGVLTACDQVGQKSFSVNFMSQCRRRGGQSYAQLFTVFACCMSIQYCERASGGKLHTLLHQRIA